MWLIEMWCALWINQNNSILTHMPAKLKAKQAKVAAKAAPPKNASKSKPKAPEPPARSTSRSNLKDTKAGKDMPAPKVAKLPVAAKKTPVSKKADPPAPVVPKRGAPSGDKKEPAGGVKKTKSDEVLVKVVTKGGAAVDSLVPNKDSYRVFQDSGKIYSATLNQSNLGANNNKFYIIQILQNEANSNLFVWNRWGRVGVPGQNALRGPMPKDSAIREYAAKHHDKTVKGDYREIQIKYDDEVDEPKQEVKKGKAKDVTSKMDPALQRLMGLIFDVNIMNNTMKEIGYDAKKMPLGRLGDTTIKEAYGVLNQLLKAVKKKDKQGMMKLSGDFYSLIPHDFGFKNMASFVLDNEEKVKEKLNMLSTISDLKVTSKLLDQKGDDSENVHDQNYKKLGCSIKSVPTTSPDYKLLKEYFDNTKGSGYSKVAISDIFQVERPVEQKQYNTKLGNNMLLWHGSRVSNFGGILSQGMRIAPPEAPASGYLFGKGIYLADMAEKSINYCRSYGQPTALILLLEGAIGKPNILLNTSHSAKEEMEKNKKDSTKCHGAKAPPESSYVNHKGMIVPKGQAVPTNSGSWMGHNEYIVYNINQARIRYVLRMEMNGN